MSANCTECDRLWREYTHAYSTYLSEYNALLKAAAQQEMKRFAELEPIFQAAAEHRAAAQQEIHKHTTLGHCWTASA